MIELAATLYVVSSLLSLSLFATVIVFYGVMFYKDYRYSKKKKENKK